MNRGLFDTIVNSEPRIYTSYFAISGKIKSNADLFIVSIYRFTKKYFSVDCQFKKLAPSAELLRKECTWEEYVRSSKETF